MNEIKFRLTDSSYGDVLSLLNQVPWDNTCEIVIRAATEAETRTDAQNRLLHKWYTQLGKETGNGLQTETRYCKLHFGVPIVREHNDDYRKAYDQSIKRLPYEQKLQAMDYWPVTRSPFMGVNMMTEYLNEIDRYAADCHQVVLVQPPDIYDLAMGKK